jgi:hypothetical protein
MGKKSTSNGAAAPDAGKGQHSLDQRPRQDSQEKQPKHWHEENHQDSKRAAPF